MKLFSHLLRTQNKVRYRICLIIALIALASPGCSKKDLFADECDNSNPNCGNASAELATEGAVSDLTQQPIASGASTPQLAMKPTRFGQPVVIEYILTNPRLIPLRGLAMELDPGDPTIEIDSDFEGGCGRKSFLFYKQSCRFRLEYLPGTAFSEQTLAIRLLTLTGSPYTIHSSLESAVILPDFSIESADLAFPDTLVYATASGGYFEREITVTNHGTADIESMNFSMTASPEFSLAPPEAGSCADGQTLSAEGGTCKIKVRFKPTSPGMKTTALMFAGLPGVSRTHSLYGVGLRVSPTPGNIDFGFKTVGSAVDTQTIRFSNPSTNGNPDAQNCEATSSGSAQFQIIANTCALQIPVGAECDVTVQFTPDSVEGNHYGALTLACDDRGGQMQVDLQAATTDTPLITDLVNIDFGDQMVGTKAYQTLTFTNVGGTALTAFLRDLEALSGTGLSLFSETCTTSLAASASCEVVVEYAPTDSGASLASLEGAADGDVNVPITVTGNGIQIEADRSSLSLGPVLVGNNALGADLLFTNPSLTQSASGCVFQAGDADAQGFTFENGSTCLTATTLAPNESCILKTKFTAALPYGSKSATVRYECTAGGADSVTLEAETVETLALVALPPANLEISNRLVGITATVTQRFYNADPNLTADSVSIVTPGISAPWSLTQGCAVTSLAPGDSCDVTLEFSPLATPYGAEQAGTYSGEILATADNITLAPVPYSGTAMKISVTPALYDFGTVPTGSDVDSTDFFYVRNPSSVDEASGCVISATAPFQLINSSCGANIARDDLCQFQVRLPAQVNSAEFNNAKVQMDCSVGGRAEVALTALAQKAPVLEWSGTADFGDLDIGLTQQSTFTLTHTGVAPDASSNLPLIRFTETSSPAYSVISSTCTAPLAPGESCAVVVAFAPATAGALSATLEAYSGDTIYDAINLIGNGFDSSLRVVISPSTISLTNRLVGATIDTDVSLSNDAPSGAATSLVIGNPSSGAPWSLGVSPSACGSTLDVGDSCQVRLTYAPVVVGATSGTMDVSASNMTPSVKSISYSGSAVKITASTDTLAFGTIDLGVNTTHPTTVTITNPSPTDSATSCTLTATGPFVIANSTCGSSLNVSSNCSFQVTLPSQSTNQILDEVAQMTCAVGGQASVVLSADVFDLPDLRWATTPSPDWGEQDVDQASQTRTYTLENTGTTAAQLSDLGFSVSSPGFTITGGTCTSTTLLSAGSSCTVAVKFDALSDTTASGGEKPVLSASITTPRSASFDLDLTGTGTTMSLSITPVSLAFNTREVGQTGSQSKTAVLTNSGTRTANLTYSALTDASFSRAGTCGATLAAGASCNLTVSIVAAATPTVHSEDLTVTETFAGATKTVQLSLSGETVQAAVFQGIDNRASTTYAATIASTDITGPVDDANNIVDLSPASRDVTFTLKNNSATAADLQSIDLNLSYTSGQNATMTLVSDNCSGATLSNSTPTCTFNVRYTPTATPQTSFYSLSATATSSISGATYSFSVTSIKGTSIEGAQLVLASPLSLDVGSASGSLGPKSFTLQNTGTQKATGLTYSFADADASLTPTDDTLFSIASDLPGDCGAELAGQSSCTLRIAMNPSSAAGSFAAKLKVNGDQDGADIWSLVRAATYKEVSFGADYEGYEGDITTDASRFYLVSRVQAATRALYLNICSRTSQGALDPSTCQANSINALLGNSGTSVLGGDSSGYGPRVKESGKKIIITTQNKDTLLGGNATGGGNATIIICQKPTSGNTLADCKYKVVNTDNKPGDYASIAVTSNQIILSSTNASKQLLLIACSYDNSTDSVPAPGDWTCGTPQIVAGADSGWHTSIAFDGSQAIIASYYAPAVGTKGLQITLCSVASNNVITTPCSSSVIDNELWDDGGNILNPGAYPSLVISDNKLFVAHQLGESRMRLRLSSCSYQTGSLDSCTNRTVDSTSGAGFTPRISISGNSSTGRLWISAVKLANVTLPSSDSRIGIYSCSLPLTDSASCTSVTPYFLQPLSRGTGSIYSRSLFFDPTWKQVTVPFKFTSGGELNRNGILNLGLIDEIY